MSNYKTTKIMDNFYSIEMNNMVRSFLFLGDGEALLVDTCFGGELKEEIAKITDFPVSVVFTHADPDHVGGAEAFDQRFMNPCEFDFYVNGKTEPVPMIPIWEGDLLELGDFSFEVVSIPGHTPGSIALLEEKKRFLIGGDSIQKGGPIFMSGPGRNFEALHASMEKLLEMVDLFDVVYSSHNELEVDPSTIAKMVEGTELMITDRPEGKPIDMHGRTMTVYQIGDVSFFA